MRPNSVIKSRLHKPTFSEVKSPPISSRKKNSLSTCLSTEEDLKPKKTLSDNVTFAFSKLELEKRMHNFIEVVFNKKAFLKNSPTLCFNELKTTFFTPSQEEIKPLSVNVRIDNLVSNNKENGVLSSQLESDYQKRIQELEENQIGYEEKIKNHASYTLELEQKVGLLITEFEKTLATNDKLINEIQVLKQEDSILRDSDKQHTDSSSEIEELSLKNSQLQNEITSIKGEIMTLRAKVLKYQEVEKTNRDLNDEIEELRHRLQKTMEDTQEKETFIKDFDLIEDLRHENEVLKEELMAKSDLIECYKHNQISLANQLESVQQEQKDSHSVDKEEFVAKSTVEFMKIELEEYRNLSGKLKKDIEGYKTMDENYQKELEGCKEQIEKLMISLKKTNEEKDTLNKRNETLEEELSSKEKLKILVKSLLEKIEGLETKIGSLLEENINLQAAKENNLQLISNLKNEMEEKNAQFVTICLEDSKDKSFDQRTELTLLQVKDFNLSSAIVSPKNWDDAAGRALQVKETEFEEERAKYKIQIEQYNHNLEQLISKIQTLVKINETIGRDLEYLKYEFKSYRTLVWSVFQETKKHLDKVKDHDDQVEVYFTTKSGDDAQNFSFLLDAYYVLRREAISIDFLLEERKSFI